MFHSVRNPVCSPICYGCTERATEPIHGNEIDSCLGSIQLPTDCASSLTALVRTNRLQGDSSSLAFRRFLQEFLLVFGLLHSSPLVTNYKISSSSFEARAHEAQTTKLASSLIIRLESYMTCSISAATMKPQELADTIFSLEKNVRYIAVVGGPNNEVLESRMREGVKSLSGDKEDRWFAQVLAPVMLEGARELERDLGLIAYSLIRFFKVTMLTMRIQEYFVTVSMEPSVDGKALYERIIGHIRLF